MIPLALAASLTLAVENLDWSKASDDLKLGWLKPVMTETEVRRLFAGKVSDRQACGMAMNADGKPVPFCGGCYGYTLTGGKVGVTIMFDMHGPTREEEMETKEKRDPDPPAWDPWMPRSPKPVPKWTLARFRVGGGVLYKRNKDGLYVAEKK